MMVVHSAGRRTMIFLCFLSIIVLAGCSTFRGPGSLVYGGAKDARPSVVSNGDRIDSWSTGEMSFDWPVDEAKISRGFLVVSDSGSKSKRKKKRRPHYGLDLANRKGTPILAAQAGRVVYIGSGFRGYGRLIVIEHSGEWATLYSHLHKFLVKEGQMVAQGEKIGLMGRTGRATGVHLHFEIRHNRRPVNPLAYLPPMPGQRAFGEYALAPHEGSSHSKSQDSLESPSHTD